MGILIKTNVQGRNDQPSSFVVFSSNVYFFSAGCIYLSSEYIFVRLS